MLKKTSYILPILVVITVGIITTSVFADENRDESERTVTFEDEYRGITIQK